ncbi:MAG: DNA-directed RNA polymerase subunit omega [Planctomycetota bacterium]
MLTFYSREELVAKVGGYFALCALINKRKRELATGMPPLVQLETDNLDDVVAEEIMQGKIKLKLAKFDLAHDQEFEKLDLIR